MPIRLDVLCLHSRHFTILCQIEELKQSRKNFQALQQQHGTEKTKYDDAVAKLTGDRQALEDDCSELHTEMMEKERRYHSLLCKDGTSDIATLPEFDSLASQVDKKGVVKHSEEYMSNQLAMFSNLKRLLELKDGGEQ